MTTSWPVRRSLIVGAALSSAYGLILRLIFGVPGPAIGLSDGLVMTATFLTLGPIAIGYIAISSAEKLRRRAVWQWIFVPWLPITVSSGAAGLLRLEGLICIVFALPIALTFASVGGLIAGLLARRTRRRAGFVTTCVAFLPFFLAPVEGQMNAPIQDRRVETQIVIDAPAQRVWANIERVPRIERSELPSTWNQRIGFPRPLEASLSFEGVGGVRYATFAGGLLFIETITTWEPNHVICFSIRADSEHIPKTTLDGHVTIGGKYFDVLDGRYEIKSLPSGRVLLNLSSDERLSTDFNAYAGLWSDAVMKSIQENILQVVKHRCEGRQ